MKIALNVKNMKNRLVNYSGEQRELESIWNTFAEMQHMGFISDDEWRRFYDECKGWYVDDNAAEVRDSEHDDKLIWRYNPDTSYGE